MAFVYEGERIPDGEYPLGQLSKPRHGRVHKSRSERDMDELVDDMLVKMDQETFDQLFDFIRGREHPISDFTAVVKNCEIIHVHE
jgi:hypothetical protein